MMSNTTPECLHINRKFTLLGEVFGQAVQIIQISWLNSFTPQYMVVCILNDPKFFKLFPLKKLNANFLFKPTNIFFELYVFC